MIFSAFILYLSNFLKISTAFTPPKPKVLDMAVRISIFLAWWGT
jgi:hypothetical protein